MAGSNRASMRETLTVPQQGSTIVISGGNAECSYEAQPNEAVQ